MKNILIGAQAFCWQKWMTVGNFGSRYSYYILRRPKNLKLTWFFPLSGVSKCKNSVLNKITGFNNLVIFNRSWKSCNTKFIKTSLTYANIFSKIFENQQKVPLFPIFDVSEIKVRHEIFFTDFKILVIITAQWWFWRKYNPKIWKEKIAIETELMNLL